MNRPCGQCKRRFNGMNGIINDCILCRLGNIKPDLEERDNPYLMVLATVLFISVLFGVWVIWLS